MGQHQRLRECPKKPCKVEKPKRKKKTLSKEDKEQEENREKLILEARFQNVQLSSLIARTADRGPTDVTLSQRGQSVSPYGKAFTKR